MPEDLKDDLSNYDESKYKKPSVTVDIAICTIIDNELKVLLIKRKYPPYRDCWAIPGGFLEVDKKENLEETAMRELQEETNLKDIYLEQLKTYGDPDRDPRTRVITVSYFALIPWEAFQEQSIAADSDAKEIQWFSFKRLPELAFDHKEILSDLLNRLRGKILYSPIAFALVPERFTWGRLQSVYESVLGKKMIPANFRRKIMSSYKIRQIKRGPKKDRKTKLGRPPILLKFDGVRQF